MGQLVPLDWDFGSRIILRIDFFETKATIALELSLLTPAQRPRTREGALLERIKGIDLISAIIDGLRPAPSRLWQPDGALDHCPLCSGRFTLLNRRHHCRVCLQLRCGSCAPDVPPRVCAICRRKAAQYESLMRVRSLERAAWQAPTASNVMAVCRAYRDAIEAFAASDYESSSILKGLHSFLNLDEIRAVLPSLSTAPSPVPQ